MEKYLGLKNDGLLYATPYEQMFIKKYKKKWTETMSETYYQSEVVDLGHKLRPRLVFWGYLSNASFDFNVLDDIAQVAVCVELIHKASLLIDDFIDKDTYRHSKPTFYVEYGIEKTIIYSLNILSRSLELLNNTYFKSKRLNSFYYRSMNDIIKTLQDMTLGVLKELDLDKKTLLNTTEIKKIMHLETSSLITNSLLMGFYLSGKDNVTIEKTIKSVGENLGYVFQILNDMESFFSLKLNEHKGSFNNDIDRVRKNICLPILFSKISKKDKKLVYKSNFKSEIMIKLLKDYNIKQVMFDEVDNTIKKVKSEIFNSTAKYNNHNWDKEFFLFINSVISVFKARID